MHSAKSCARSALLLVAFLALVPLGCGDDDSSNRSSAVPLRILVTNDDGFAADGIDAIVKALIADRRNEVTVCAPKENRSGSGDATGPSTRCGDLAVTAAATQSGYAATAVNGCPADAVNYAFAHLYAQGRRPHVVIAGINQGQNVSRPVATRLSGTVGAAKTATRQGIAALAASQGSPADGVAYDYPAGVAAVLKWLADHRAALQAGVASVSDVDNLNIPTCSPGSSIRGTLVGIPLATSSVGALNTQNCASTLQDPQNDVEALLNGYTTLSKVPLENG
jgi:5'/3'-nucleotidase